MDSISFIHISDTHIGSNKSFQLYNRNTFEASFELIQQINKTSLPVDFVVHSGDVVNQADRDSLQLAKSLFSKLEKPSFFINGNHDIQSIVDFLQTGSTEPIDGAGTSRFFIFKDFIFLLLDTQGPQEIDPHGEFLPNHEVALKKFLYRYKHCKIIVFCHFPPLPIDCPWIDKDMLIINGENLHNLLRNSDIRVLGVFYGHIHHQTSQNRDGIFYVSAPSPFSRFSISSLDQTVNVESEIPVSLNYVTLFGNNVIVKTIEKKCKF